MTLYECRNVSCTLGTRHHPGSFTGGATAEQVLMITGDPEAPYGAGVCPNCGEPGVEAGTHEHIPDGDDPLASLHQSVMDKVARGAVSPTDAQAELLKAVSESG